MPDPTHHPMVQLVDLVLDDLDRVRGQLDGARLTLAAAAETVEAQRVGLTALREQLVKTSAAAR